MVYFFLFYFFLRSLIQSEVEFFELRHQRWTGFSFVHLLAFQNSVIQFSSFHLFPALLQFHLLSRNYFLLLLIFYQLICHEINLNRPGSFLLDYFRQFGWFLEQSFRHLSRFELGHTRHLLQFLFFTSLIESFLFFAVVPGGFLRNCHLSGFFFRNVGLSFVFVQRVFESVFYLVLEGLEFFAFRFQSLANA